MTTSWASVPRTRAPRAEVLAPPSTRAGVRSTALAVSGGLLAVSAAACATSVLSSTPVQAEEPAAALAAAQPTAPSSARSVRFDYSAAVRPNQVYDTERAESPAPLFRSLVESVEVGADYTGPAARLQLLARLSSTTGWSTTVPLAGPVAVEGRGRVHAPLDLGRLEARAAVVAQQTGMPFEGMTVELVAVVRDGSSAWRPSVSLALTSQQLRLTGEPTTLVVRDGAESGGSGVATAAPPTPASRLADLLDWRPGGVLTTLAVALAAGGGVVVTRRRREEDDADRARRRLGRLLLDATPADLSGLRVVRVASPDALARLAERYGLLVLHWTEGERAVFVVQDDGTAYRWTTGAPDDPEPTAGPEAHHETDTEEAARREAARREAARLEAERQERLRREAERRRAAEAAEAARQQAVRAQAARVEAERVEQRLQAQAEQARKAWLALEPDHGAQVPAPRHGSDDAVLPAGPPVQAG